MIKSKTYRVLVCLILLITNGISVPDASQMVTGTSVYTLAPPLFFDPLVKQVNGYRKQMNIHWKNFDGNTRKELFKSTLYDRKSFYEYLRVYPYPLYGVQVPKLSTIYMEILENAFDSIVDRQISFKEDQDFEPEITIEVFLDDGYVVTNIIDNGIPVEFHEDGRTPVKRKRDPNIQFSKGRIIGGSGYSISSGYARELGGSIELSALKTGTKAEIRIPIKQMPSEFNIDKDERIFIENKKEKQKWEQEMAEAVADYTQSELAWPRGADAAAYWRNLRNTLKKDVPSEVSVMDLGFEFPDFIGQVWDFPQQIMDSKEFRERVVEKKGWTEYQRIVENLIRLRASILSNEPIQELDGNIPDDIRKRWKYVLQDYAGRPRFSNLTDEHIVVFDRILDHKASRDSFNANKVRRYKEAFRESRDATTGLKDIPWSVLADYKFIKILEATNYWDNAVDPYIEIKEAGCSKGIDGFLSAVNIDRFDGQGEEHVRDSLGEMLDILLTGNMYSDPTHATTSEKSDLYMVNDKDKAVSRLMNLREQTLAGKETEFHILHDNVGLELVSIFLFIDFCIKNNVIKKFVLHTKNHPYCVSDVAGQADFDMQLFFMTERGGQMAGLAERIKKYLYEEENVEISEPHWFLSLGQNLADMPEDFYSRLKKADMIMAIGDFLYRKAFLYRNWEYTADSKSILSYFPAPTLIVRMVKSPMLAGVSSAVNKTIEEMADGALWRQAKHGVLDMVTDPGDLDDNAPPIDIPAEMNRTTFYYMSMLIGQDLKAPSTEYLESTMPGSRVEWMRKEIRRHVSPAELAISRTYRDKLLAGYELDGLYYDPQGGDETEGVYYLPLYRKDKILYYKFFLPEKYPDERVDMKIPLGDGSYVCAKIEGGMGYEIMRTQRLLEAIVPFKTPERDNWSNYIVQAAKEFQDKGHKRISGVYLDSRKDPVHSLRDHAGKELAYITARETPEGYRNIEKIYVTDPEKWGKNARGERGIGLGEELIKLVLEKYKQPLIIAHLDNHNVVSLDLLNTIARMLAQGYRVTPMEDKYIMGGQDVVGEEFFGIKIELPEERKDFDLNNIFGSGLTRPHFSYDGVAMNDTADELVIQYYQEAINRVIKWAEQKNIPLSKIRIAGSFAEFHQLLPRMGSFLFSQIKNWLLMRRLYPGKVGPSDIDIVLSIDEKEMEGLQDEAHSLEKEIQKTFGIKVDIWVYSRLKKGRSYVPISKYAGRGLIHEYKKKTEQTHSIEFAKAVEETQPSFIALGTSWIEGYEMEGNLQHNALNPLLSSIANFCEKRKIPFICGDDKTVAHKVKQIKTANPTARGVVLAGEDIINTLGLENDENVFLAGVNNGNLTIDSYLPVMEMLALLLRLLEADFIDEESIKKEHER